MTKPEEEAGKQDVARENAKTIAHESGPPDAEAHRSVKESNDKQFETEKEQQEDGK